MTKASSAENIVFGAGFFVKPSKGKDETDIAKSIEGGQIGLDLDKKTRLVTLLNNALSGVKNHIVFSPVSGNSSENRTRSQLLNFCTESKTRAEIAKTFAVRLATVMDERAKEVLFLELLEKMGVKFRVIFLTLERTETINAQQVNGRMNLNFGPGFPEDYFKATIYEGDPQEKNSFLKGSVADFQSSQRNKIASDYWVFDFLESENEMTNATATSMVTQAIKQIYEKADSKDKEQILTSLDILKSSGGKQFTPQQIIDEFLPESQKERAKKKLNLTEEQQKTQFKLDVVELNRQFQTKTLVIDNEIYIRGPNEVFDKRIKEERTDVGVKVTITGKSFTYRFGLGRRKKNDQ